MSNPRVPGAQNDNSLRNTSAREAENFPAFSTLPKVSNQALNAWKTAINNKKNIAFENLQAPVEHNQKQLLKPEVENNHARGSVNQHLQPEQFDTESTIQQLKDNYWRTNGGDPVSENVNAVPSNINLTNVSPVLSAEATKTTTSATSEIELQNLLEKFCTTLYMNPQAGVNHLNNVVLDVSHTLAGTMIEISQQGAFLHVKLYSSDQETLRAMKRDRERLSEGLSASTNLVVQVEAIFRDQNNGSNV